MKMRRCVVVVGIMVWLLAKTVVIGQGTVFFYNHLPGSVDAPVFDVDGTTKLGDPTYVAQLWWSFSPAGTHSPASQPQPFQTGVAAGYWQPPTEAVEIPGIPGGNTVFFLVRVWSGSDGSFASANSRVGAKTGQSSLFSVVLGGATQGGTQPPTLPADLAPLRSFALRFNAAIPEPSTVVMGLLGGVALLFRRGRNP